MFEKFTAVISLNDETLNIISEEQTKVSILTTFIDLFIYVCVYMCLHINYVVYTLGVKNNCMMYIIYIIMCMYDKN